MLVACILDPHWSAFVGLVLMAGLAGIALTSETRKDDFPDSQK